MKKKRKMLATGAVMAAMLFTGSGSALAQSAPARTENSRELSSNGEAVYAYDNFQEEESANGKGAAEILTEQGFSPSQIQKLMSYNDENAGDTYGSDED